MHLKCKSTNECAWQGTAIQVAAAACLLLGQHQPFYGLSWPFSHECISFCWLVVATFCVIMFWSNFVDSNQYRFSLTQRQDGKKVGWVEPFSEN